MLAPVENMGSYLFCDRCARPTPDDFDSDPWDSSNYADESLLPSGWRLVNDGDSHPDYGQLLAVACPGCLTADETGRASVAEET